jgi:hypothetical protein
MCRSFVFSITLSCVFYSVFPLFPPPYDDFFVHVQELLRGSVLPASPIGVVAVETRGS